MKHNLVARATPSIQTVNSPLSTRVQEIVWYLVLQSHSFFLRVYNATMYEEQATSLGLYINLKLPYPLMRSLLAHDPIYQLLMPADKAPIKSRTEMRTEYYNLFYSYCHSHTKVGISSDAILVSLNAVRLYMR